MRKLRLAASIPVILALALVFIIHRQAAASPHGHRADAEQIGKRTLPQPVAPSYDVEGGGYICNDGVGGKECSGGNPPYNAGFYDCGSDTPGCTEAWVDADGPPNNSRGGKPYRVLAGCGHSFTDGATMHFQYASIDTTKVTGAALIAGDIGDNGKDTPAFFKLSGSGTGYDGNDNSYATSFAAVTENQNHTNLMHVNNGGGGTVEGLLSGGFTVSFKGIVDETISGESGSGNALTTYLPNGTISCTIDASNNPGDTDFDAEVE